MCSFLYYPRQFVITCLLVRAEFYGQINKQSVARSGHSVSYAVSGVMATSSVRYLTDV